MFDPRHFLLSTEHEWHTLVQQARYTIEDPFTAGGGGASRLLDQEADWIGFIKQA